MKEIKFMPLIPEQIEVRVGEAKYKGSATLLLYIDSRAAANILNEAVGEYNWQIEYKDVAGQIYGRLSIWDDDRKMWVYKEDTGSESNIEAQKGMSSDILKRCLARWGCDYLYSSPKIKISCKDEYYYNDRMTMTFFVKEIGYEGKKINRLVIVDRNGYAVFVYDNGKVVTGQGKTQVATQPTAVQKTNAEILKEYCVQLSNTEDKKEIREFYDFYTKRLKEREWTGPFDVQQLWAKHLQRYSRQRA